MSGYGTEFDGKVAVVTGAAQGIGRGLAEGLAASGCRVVIADLNLAAAAATAAAIGGKDRAVACRVDITDAASVKALAEATLAAFGQVDILVNNAGVLKSHFIAEFPVAEWDLVLDLPSGMIPSPPETEGGRPTIN